MSKVIKVLTKPIDCVIVKLPAKNCFLKSICSLIKKIGNNNSGGEQ